MMPLDLDSGLARLGYASFRPGQREAILTLLETGRLLLVAPTGGGKSLIYQLPATLLPGTTLVISPLVSLMHDQVQALEARGVAATFLAATLSAEEMRERLKRLRAGGLKLAYVAPERLAYPGFRGLLRDLAVPLLAVDEAHCISEWGHDFRPDYLEIGALVEELRPPRVLACTATATPVVRDEILARLRLPPDTPQLVRGFARPNLGLRARVFSPERERDREVDGLLAEALGAPGAGRGTAIVYGPTRRSTEDEATRLAGRGWRTAAYHAGMNGRSRDAAQRAFMDGSLEVVVATNAFGMGIDRADVRAVVHLGPPGSVEAYYQE
ncbi:MAG: RecQ family ATP-dependent DNA helicase, partial [Solirubrobacterales bacterium]